MKRIYPLIIIGLILLLTSSVWAVKTAVVSVPEEGEYYYWFTYIGENSTQEITTPYIFKDKTATIKLPLMDDVAVKSTMYLLNNKTGNMAVLPINSKPEDLNEFKLQDSDFNKVRRVDVKVISDKDQFPVAAAVVRLQDSEKRIQSQVLEPSAEGVAQFFNVALGIANISVKYGDGRTSSDDVEIEKVRKSPVSEITITVSGNVPTVQAAKTGDAKTEVEGNKESGTASDKSKFNYASFLVGIILLLGIVYGTYRLLKNKGLTGQQALQSLGVNLPQDQQQTPVNGGQAVVVDPGTCPFCGGKKDPATGACACSAAPGTSSGGAGGGPRLIATQGVYSGSIFPLSSDSATIGREESNTIPFPQDNTASRRHARISNENGQWVIHDEGSSNGTFVNGVKVTDQQLRPGDEVQVGSTRMRFEV